jgi:hypothetical protein
LRQIFHTEWISSSTAIKLFMALKSFFFKKKSCGDRRDGSREVGLELGYLQPTVIRKLSVVVILLGNGHD